MPNIDYVGLFLIV